MQLPRSLVLLALLAVGNACSTVSVERARGDGTGGTGGAGGHPVSGTGGGGGVTASSSASTSSSGSVVSASSAGSGGSGGADVGPTHCPKLIDHVQSLDVVRLWDFEPPMKPIPAYDPQLVRMSNGDVLLLARYSYTVQKPSWIEAFPFYPWSSWDPSIGPFLYYDVNADGALGAAPFAAAAEPSDTLALAARTSACSRDAIWGEELDPPPGNFEHAILPGTCTDLPLAITTTAGGRHFVAWDVDASVPGMPPMQNVVAYDPAGPMAIPPGDHCASTPHVGDVLADGEDLLFVHSAADDETCSMAGAPPPGPAHRLVLRRIASGSETANIVYDGIDDLVYVRLLPRTDGQWLVWKESGASMGIEPPAMAMKLAADGTPGAVFPVTDASSDHVAAAEMGDGFVVAFSRASNNPEYPDIVVRVFSQDGDLWSESSHNTAFVGVGGDRLALVTSGAGVHPKVLVGWADAANGDMSPITSSTVWLHRFDCSD